MSWPEARRAGAAALAALALAGCGFRPLHGEATARAVAGVEVAPIPGRAGEALRDALSRSLHPGGRRGAADYRLEVDANSSSGALITGGDTFVRRYDIVLRARYRLVESATGREIEAGTREARASHGVPRDEIYSALVAAETALRRSAALLATAISTDVALALDGHAAP